MAPTPARNHRTMPPDELGRLYAEGGWESKLQECEQYGRMSVGSAPGRGRSKTKTIRKWWDADGNTVAVIMTFQRDHGERRVICMLRDGDDVYSVPDVDS